MSKKNIGSKPIIPRVKGMIGSKYIESILVDCKPSFLVWDTRLQIFSIQYRIDLPDKILCPLDVNGYGYFPYCFTSKEIENLNSVISKEEIIDEVLDIVRQYVAVPERDHILITGEILLTYCLEHIDTLHFPYFVGETESGKSTCLYLGKWLAYRCLMSHNLSLANIYNFLGIDEEGTGTICEDEAQDMASDREKIRIYKNSYSKGSVKPRVIMTSFGKYQVFYKTFCCKWFAGENVPHDKGFLERLVIIYMLGGKPRGNLKSATTKEKYFLNKLKNELLFWKMQNIGKNFPRIDTGLFGRNQELWQDLLSIFHGTKFENDAKKVSDFYLKQRKESIKDSLEAKIFRSIKLLLEQNMEIESRTIWNKIINSDELPGKLDEKTGNTFYLDEEDRKLTKNSVADIIRFKFQAKKKVEYKKEGEKRKKTTLYIFDEEIIGILSEKYHVEDSL